MLTVFYLEIVTGHWGEQNRDSWVVIGMRNFLLSRAHTLTGPHHR